MKIVLISTYELGRQPFGLASPAAILRARGHEVVTLDTAAEPARAEPLRDAGLVAFFLPMHTATRLAVPLIGKVRALNPKARICCYGLYAVLSAEFLRTLGAGAILGGEYETGLLRLASGEDPGVPDPPGRTEFLTPDRSGLPPLDRYAKLAIAGGERITGYTESSRGCKHSCRHCPVVPVYRGTFRAVPAAVVLADIRRQVEAGAQHITFGDPDFFNGPAHALRIVEALSREFPAVTYDVTIKIEHLLRHRDALPVLARTGCVLITSAVESVDDAVLARLDKGHTRADFKRAVELCRANGLALSPTFIPFTPWTTRESYCELLRVLAKLDLVENVSPVQLALRLLIPAGSLLSELEEIRGVMQPFDPAALVHRWSHPDPAMDRLADDALRLVAAAGSRKHSRTATFRQLWELAAGSPPDFHLPARTTIPYLTEPWYC